MADPGYVVLLVDADAGVRARLVDQLSPLGCGVLEAADGDTAMHILRENSVRVVVSELYLKTGEDKCLFQTVRRTKALRDTRALAHTRHGTSSDCAWAKRVGADAYLIRPTGADRLQYVVARLAREADRGGSAASSPATRSAVARRDSLDVALLELERGSLKGTSAIVFGREWWTGLTPRQKTTYRARAEKAHVSLRSDSLLSNRFVEVRGPSASNKAAPGKRS